LKDWEKETWITEKKPSGVCGRPSCLSRRRSSGRAAATWTPSTENTGTRRAFLPRFSSPGASMRWVIPNASALRCWGRDGRRRPLRMFPAECAVYSGTAAARKTHHGPDRGDGAGRRDLLPVRRYSGVAAENANRSPVHSTGLLRSHIGIIPRPGACPRPPGRSDRTPASRRSWGR